MPSKDPRIPLREIRDNIDFALSCVQGYTLDVFLNDQKKLKKRGLDVCLPRIGDEDAMMKP